MIVRSLPWVSSGMQDKIPNVYCTFTIKVEFNTNSKACKEVP